VTQVLVTGGAGFVGATLVRDLLDEGIEVRVLDDLSSGRREYLRGLPLDLRRGTVGDAATVRRAASGCHAIVHLAARSGVGPSVTHPELDFDVNVRGTFNVLDVARRSDVGRVVFASSGAVVAGARPPLSEELLPQPLAPYGASKLYGEGALAAFSSVYGFSGISLRFSNVYGPFCSHKGSVVAAFCRRALRGQPLLIHGSGRQTRDFVHVNDISRAVRIALRSPSTGVFQLGAGVETSINRLARLVSEAAGTPLRVERLRPKPGEARRNYADIARARRILRFEPRVALEDGLADTVAWMSERNPTGRRAVSARNIPGRR
jgi:UDP-glucose 4-epimerase